MHMLKQLPLVLQLPQLARSKEQNRRNETEPRLQNTDSKQPSTASPCVFNEECSPVMLSLYGPTEKEKNLGPEMKNPMPNSEVEKSERELGGQDAGTLVAPLIRRAQMTTASVAQAAAPRDASRGASDNGSGGRSQNTGRNRNILNTKDRPRATKLQQKVRRMANWPFAEVLKCPVICR